jgi:hypothetical protein
VPVGNQDQVPGLHVLVDDRRRVPVEVVERGGRLAHVLGDLGRWETGVAAVGEDARQTHALDPVHHDAVAIFVEEVLADDREAGMRLQAEEHPSLPEEAAAFELGADMEDLERDDPIVLVVEDAGDLALTAVTEDRKDLVALAYEPRSHLTPVSCAGPRSEGTSRPSRSGIRPRS